MVYSYFAFVGDLYLSNQIFLKSELPLKIYWYTMRGLTVTHQLLYVFVFISANIYCDIQVHCDTSEIEHLVSFIELTCL